MKSIYRRRKVHVRFILKDLKRGVEYGTELCASYSPHSTTRIYNAGCLRQRCAGVGATTGKQGLLDWAERAARYVITHQRPDGSWTYGDEPSQQWIDNFHTAFVLFSLKRIIEAGSLGTEFQQALNRGYDWRSAFFLADGWPKYFHDPYPADAHAGASAIVTFLELGDLDEIRLIWRARSFVDNSESARRTRVLLLSKAAILHGKETLHALRPGLDALCAGDC